MRTEVAIKFRKEMEEIRDELRAFPAGRADEPWRPNGWNRKQIVGHLLDSATNNRQRFVRAALDGAYTGPGYAQADWVAFQRYEEQSWETLLRWWEAEHEMLAAIVDRIPAHRLGTECVIGGGEPLTLRFVIEDYVAHQKHHLGQIKAT